MINAIHVISGIKRHNNTTTWTSVFLYLTKTFLRYSKCYAEEMNRKYIVAVRCELGTLNVC